MQRVFLRETTGPAGFPFGADDQPRAVARPDHPSIGVGVLERGWSWSWLALAGVIAGLVVGTDLGTRLANRIRRESLHLTLVVFVSLMIIYMSYKALS